MNSKFKSNNNLNPPSLWELDGSLSEALAVRNGIILNPEGHEARYKRSYEEFYGHQPELGLLEGLKLTLPPSGYYKMRIVYNESDKKVDIAPYTPITIKTLKIVEVSNFDYHIKYSDRSAINELLALRGEYDDILIINNGKLSDTSSGNIILFRNNEWFTPDSPLLEGTQRTQLLSQNIIQTAPITKDNLINYDYFQVINALRPFNINAISPVQNIIF